MVRNNPNLTNLTYKDVAFAGATSGFITRALCQPLDVIKIRFQLQVEPIVTSSNSKYTSIFQAICVISKEEGVKSFWKGHVPAQWLSISYGLAQFWCYEFTSNISYDLGYGGKANAGSNFVCGSIAGAVSTFVSFPFDVVRTRLVAQNETCRTYTGVFHTFSHILRNEGFLVLFRGFLPTVIQVAPHTGVQFMTYKLFEKLYQHFLLESDSRRGVFASSAICGSLAGLCAKTAIYPLDLAKKRMQIQGFERKAFGQNFVCTGLVDCIRKTYRFEGLLGLYKGLSPSLVKAIVTTALHFSTYELICLEISKYRY